MNGGEDMRTSRISSNTQSINPNARKTNIVSDIGFRSSMNQNPHQHLKDEQKKEKKRKNNAIKLSTNKSILIVKGIRFIGENGARVHNHLLHNAKVIQYHTKIKVRNNIYKTSI